MAKILALSVLLDLAEHDEPLPGGLFLAAIDETCAWCDGIGTSSTDYYPDTGLDFDGRDEACHHCGGTGKSGRKNDG